RHPPVRTFASTRADATQLCGGRASSPPTVSRRRLLEPRRQHDEHRERGGERHRRRSARERPAVDGAYADHEQQDAPRCEAEVDAAEDGVPAAVVVAARAEQILAVDGDAQRPEGQERQRERRGGETEYVARAQPRALAPEPTRSTVEQAAAEPED